MVKSKDIGHVARAAVTRSRRTGRSILLSWDANLDGELEQLGRTDLLDVWSAARTHADRTFFWSSAWSGRQLVAVGSAVDIAGRGPGRFRDVQRTWARTLDGSVTAGSPPALLGGFAFRPRASVAQGTELPDALLWVPAALVVRHSAAEPARLTLNTLVSPTTDPAEIIEDLAGTAAVLTAAPTSGTFPRKPQPTLVRELPSQSSWERLVADAVAEIRQGSFEKVVLARQVDLHADAGFDPVDALRHLRVTSPLATAFAADVHGACFFGATPEHLIQVTGGEVRTHALAGSAPRGGSAQEDAELEQQLLASGKDRHEHDLVTRSLVAALQAHCQDVWHEPGPTVVKLPHVQHLRTRVGARSGERGLLEMVAALHPTPALGGHPAPAALRWLRAHEPFDRGWYAAPVGWTDATGEGEFAVAIRSALLRGARASLFAGCGVVADSQPAAEYEETQLKLHGMRIALGAA